jgi:hypothetical protein
MTTPLENTVRPFAQLPIHPQRVVLPAPIAHAEIDCKLGGSGGTTTSFTLPTTSGRITTSQENYKESDRKSTLVRVENPDDPTQFVEFCRADKITLTKENKSPPTPPRTSSYDLTGAMHGGEDRTTRNYSYKYPTDKACTPRSPPKGGDC